jgi:hypothetical protein
MKVMAVWRGRSGTVIDQQAGRVLVEFSENERAWILRGVEGFHIFDQKRGRPRKNLDNAAKQRAYRERRKGKALRKYVKKKAD